ncbi:MAG: hypothetical protein HWE34_15545 [Methylocystaceae bacterium]|nr:hypothetical protein [Methylocystaceae bacterium]
MFAYIEGGKLIKFQQTPSHPETGEPLLSTAKGTLANLGWLPVEIQAAEMTQDQTRGEDIIIIDGDTVRVIQTVRDLSDEEAFHKIKNNILLMIEKTEQTQSDRAERELLLELAQHLNLTSSKAYAILKEVDDNITAQRALLGHAS